MIKESFVLYSNYNEQIKLLNMQERGELLTAIFSHVNEEELPTMTNTTKMLYSIISGQIDRDSKKYAETCEKRAQGGQKGAEYGVLGGRPKKISSESIKSSSKFCDDIVESSRTRDLIISNANLSADVEHELRLTLAIISMQDGELTSGELQVLIDKLKRCADEEEQIKTLQEIRE